MAHSLHAHHYRYPEFLQFHTDQGLRTAGLLVITILFLAIVFVGFSLMVETNSLLPRP